MDNEDEQEVENNIGDQAKPKENYRPGDSRRTRAKAREGGGGDEGPSDSGGDDDNSSGHFSFNSSMSNHTHRTYTGNNPADFKENKHVAKPPFFDGTNWDEFWSTCLDVFRANPVYFQSFRRRIEYILSFFRGDAISWKQNYQADPDNAIGNEYFDYPYNPDTDQLELPQEKHRTDVTEADWFRFMRLLKRDYETLDSRGQARHKIMYFKQGVLTAAEYFQKLDSSRRIARWLGKEYDEMVVEKLKENLNSRIVDAIYGQEKMPATYDEWKQAAIRWDNREQTKRLARGYGYRPASPAQGWHRPASPNPSYSPSNSYPPRSPTPGPSNNQARSPSPTPFRSPSPARTSRAMLPDAEYKRRKDAGECFGCGKSWTPEHKCAEKGQRIRAAIHSLDERDRASLLDAMDVDFPKS